MVRKWEGNGKEMVRNIIHQHIVITIIITAASAAAGAVGGVAGAARAAAGAGTGARTRTGAEQEQEQSKSRSKARAAAGALGAGTGAEQKQEQSKSSSRSTSSRALDEPAASWFEMEEGTPKKARQTSLDSFASPVKGPARQIVFADAERPFKRHCSGREYKSGTDVQDFFEQLERRRRQVIQEREDRGIPIIYG